MSKSDVSDILAFLGRLAKNNNRDWFHAHREEYLDFKSRTEALAEKLIAAVAIADPRAAQLSVADCTYRIYRDTRFSADKTPYKIHSGIFVNPGGGKKALTCGYYFHLQPGHCFVAAGTIGHPAPLLKAIRRDVFDNIDEYRAIVEDPEFLACYPIVGDDPLKTAPKGFPKDWEYIDYLKPRNFVASSPDVEKTFRSPRFVAEMERYIAQAKRFNDFINFTVDEFVGRQ